VKGQLVSLPHRDELELQAGGLGFGEHARTFQEDKAWLTPVSESSQSTDDLVIRT
jgi:hypothetical protein